MRRESFASLAMLIAGVMLGWLAFGNRNNTPSLTAVPPQPNQELTEAVQALRVSVAGLHDELQLVLAQQTSEGGSTSDAAAMPVSDLTAEPPIGRQQELWNILTQITGEQDNPIALMNQAATSRDPNIQALGFEYELELLEEDDAKSAALRQLARKSIHPRTVVAAKFLGRCVPDSKLEVDIRNLYAEKEFPHSWGAAIAAVECGEESLLDDWGVSLLGKLQERVPSEGVAQAALRGIRLYPASFESVEEAALRAAHADMPAGIRKAAYPALRAIGSERTLAVLERLADDAGSPKEKAAVQRASSGLDF